MRKIFIIGAGQLGSRHLQALKNVNSPLAVSVIDPSADSLAVARQRYEAMADGKYAHSIVYTSRIPQADDIIDLVIVATSSDVRRTVITELLAKTNVKHLFLEKLLFQKHDNYEEVRELLDKSGTKAWVNCSMRVMPFYKAAKREVAGKKIFYHVSGSQYGLVTNAIHYLDHIAYLTDNSDFLLDTALLDPNPIPSKRKGFLELNGTLTARFADGSLGVVTCYPQGCAPVQVQIISEDVRMIVREAEGKAWVARAAGDWRWTEVDARIPYQSEMTTGIVEDILARGECGLAPYQDSLKVHLNLLEPLRQFVNTNTAVKADLYPFT